MPFKRSFAPSEPPSTHGLTEAMAGIGMGFSAHPAVDPNIEDTLVFASAEGMDGDDLRVLAVLVTWFGVHHERVNADRLTKLVGTRSGRVQALWSSLARWKSQDRRFGKLLRLYRGPQIDVLTAGMEFQLRRHGEDPRFAGAALRVPANVLRDRPADVLTPAELARCHRSYRCRLLMGPGFRADCWAAFEVDPSLSAAGAAHRSYASFATAWQVRRDFATFREAVAQKGPTIGRRGRGRNPQ